MRREYFIDVFLELGARIANFGTDCRSREAIARAIKENIWFTESDIERAVEAIRTQMLDPQKLRAWLGRYNCDYNNSLEIAVVAAGNIPLVGFHDILCVLITGNRCLLKPSSKDLALTEYICDILKEIDPAIKISGYDPQSASTPHAVIATGSSNSNRYFRSVFGNIPSILRSSRSSIAILNGSESDNSLEGLADDIFSYSGLGCRNVSLLFVPRDYNTLTLGSKIAKRRNINPHYRNNYLQRRALLSMEQEEFTDHGFFVMTEGDQFPTHISELVVARYEQSEDIDGWVGANDESIQCISSDFYRHPRAVALGRAQLPSLFDYADGKDVMDFIAQCEQKSRATSFNSL